MLWTIVIFIVVLSILVFVHELGHFLTARSFGVKAEEFGFGFPPRVIGWYRNRLGRWRRVLGNKSIETLEKNSDESLIPGPGRTVYSLNWLPLGGFVKIKGENGEGKNDNDSFVSKSIWKRIIILSAGVIMNVVLAWFLFSLGYMMGMPQSTSNLGPRAQVSKSQVMVVQVMPNSPAFRAGLKEGDEILRADNIPIKTDQDLQQAVASRVNQKVNFLIKRGIREKKVSITPRSKKGGRAVIGVGIAYSGLVRYPFFSAIWEGAKTDVWIVKQIFVAFGNLFVEIFHGQNVGNQFAGPIGIANITGQAARLGFSYLLQFMAILSLNLAVINILPFPALDGGRILFLIIGKLKGKPVRQEIENAIHNVGFLLLIALILFITYKDIVRLF